VDLDNIPELIESVQLATDTYHTFSSPKPTYIEFIASNLSTDEWWRNRLLLLEFLTGDTGYDVNTVFQKINPWKTVLIPEMIILHSRMDQHENALKLLCHSLNDFETSIRYCLFGGVATFQLHQQKQQKRQQQHSSVRTIDRDQQSVLFNTLLVEFLNLDKGEDRIEQTSSLLERFGGWLDVGHVSPPPPPFFLSLYLFYSSILEAMAIETQTDIPESFFFFFRMYVGT